MGAHTNTITDIIRTHNWICRFANHFKQLSFALNYITFLHHQFTEINLTMCVHMQFACCTLYLLYVFGLVLPVLAPKS